LDVGSWHERPKYPEVLVHLAAAVSLDGDVRHALALHLLVGLHRPQALPAPALPLVGPRALLPGAPAATAVRRLLHERGALGDADVVRDTVGGGLAACFLVHGMMMLATTWKRGGGGEGGQGLEPKEVALVVVVLVVVVAGRRRRVVIERELGTTEVGELEHVGEAELVEGHLLLLALRSCVVRLVVRLAQHVVHHLGATSVGGGTMMLLGREAAVEVTVMSRRRLL
jgi:hypothetical protein